MVQVLKNCPVCQGDVVLRKSHNKTYVAECKCRSKFDTGKTDEDGAIRAWDSYEGKLKPRVRKKRKP